MKPNNPRRSVGRARTRRAIAIAAVAAAGVALAACTPANGAPGGGGDSKTFTIYWNAGHAYKEYKKVIDDFGAEHDLKINWQKYQWPDLTTKLVADFRSGNVPDLVEEQSAGTGVQYGVQGNVMALNDYIKQDGKKMGFPSDFQEAAVTARQYEGKTYSIPLHLTANGLLFYNKDLLREAGYDTPPTTWDEFLDVAKKTTKGDVYGFAVNSDYSYGDPWYVQQGVTYSDASKGEFMQPEAAAEKSLQFLQDLVYKEKVSPVPVATTDYSGPQKLFSAGRAAMFVSGPWDILPVTEGSGDIKWGIAPPLTGSKQAATLAGGGLMIPKKAKHADLAWELIQKLTDVKVELAVTKDTGMTMPRKSWAKDPQIASDDLLSAVAKSLSVVVQPDPALAATGKLNQLSDLYKTAYQEIVIQDKPVADALATFRNQAKAAIK